MHLDEVGRSGVALSESTAEQLLTEAWSKCLSNAAHSHGRKAVPLAGAWRSGVGLAERVAEWLLAAARSKYFSSAARSRGNKCTTDILPMVVVVVVVVLVVVVVTSEEC